MHNDFISKWRNRIIVRRKKLSGEENNSLDIANNENPSIQSVQDSASTPTREKVLRNWRTCLFFTFSSVLNIPPNYHGSLLASCCSYLIYETKISSNPFDLQFGNSTKASQSQLSLGEAFTMFFPEMAHITMFILCYLLTLMLILPLHPGVQIFFVLLLISAPLHYFPDLERKASGIGVTCSSFNLPLFWVTLLGALVLSLICVLLTLLMVYYNWIFLHKGKAKVDKIEDSLDDLKEIVLDV